MTVEGLVTVLGFVNQDKREFQTFSNYQLFKETNTNNGTGHEGETPIHVDHGYALYGLCHWLVTAGK